MLGQLGKKITNRSIKSEIKNNKLPRTIKETQNLFLLKHPRSENAFESINDIIKV